MPQKEPEEVALVERAEELEAEFMKFARSYFGLLRSNVTTLDGYRERRSILRTLDKNLDSPHARRQLTNHWKGAMPDPEEAA